MVSNPRHQPLSVTRYNGMQGNGRRPPLRMEMDVQRLAIRIVGSYVFDNIAISC